MTSIAFHFNAPDRLAYACRLIRKAWSSGAKLVVCGPPESLASLDGALWTMNATEFLPHCLVDAPAEVAAASPVILSHDPSRSVYREVLINLGADAPRGFDAFGRLIEIVTADDTDREHARSRWKHYTRLGYTITRHDLAARGAD